MNTKKSAGEPSPASAGYAVGDALAFRFYAPTRCSWELHKITKIMPSGRMVCGPFTLNPDLSVRGKSGYGGPYKAEPVTDEIVAEVRRFKALEYVRGFDWKKLSLDSLEAVIAVTRQA
jgi:hypothetical protein